MVYEGKVTHDGQQKYELSLRKSKSQKTHGFEITKMKLDSTTWKIRFESKFGFETAFEQFTQTAKVFFEGE